MEEESPVFTQDSRNPLIHHSLEETVAHCCAVLAVLSSVEVDETVSGKFRLGYPLLLHTVTEALEAHPGVKRLVDAVNREGPVR